MMFYKTLDQVIHSAFIVKSLISSTNVQTHFIFFRQWPKLRKSYFYLAGCGFSLLSSFSVIFDEKHDNSKKWIVSKSKGFVKDGCSLVHANKLNWKTDADEGREMTKFVCFRSTTKRWSFKYVFLRKNS